MDFSRFNIKTAIALFISGFLLGTTFLIIGNLRYRAASYEGFNMMFNQGSVYKDTTVESTPEKKTMSPATLDNWDYPWKLNNNYELYPTDVFGVTLVTYFDVKDIEYLKSYITRWNGPINIVVYYHSDESKLLTQFVSVCKSTKTKKCIPYLLNSETIPINKLKNIGIDAVTTSHFIFAENNLSPTTNVYSEIMSTPGYLWRDDRFVGVVPVYEWSSDLYDDAKKNYRSCTTIPNGPSSLRHCLHSYHCRPLQTTTIPMQFKWFSFVNYRAFNCISNRTELYMVLKKTSLLPRYDESITVRGYDNAEYTEKIRNSNMKMGQLCKNFFFRVSGIGIDSDEVKKNMQNMDLRNQYEQIRSKFLSTISNHHPIICCSEIEPSMHSWVNYISYRWEKEQTENNKYYPKIAVKGKDKDHQEL